MRPTGAPRSVLVDANFGYRPIDAACSRIGADPVLPASIIVAVDVQRPVERLARNDIVDNFFTMHPHLSTFWG